MRDLICSGAFKSIGESLQYKRTRYSAGIKDSYGAFSLPAGTPQLCDHPASSFLPLLRRV